MSVEPGKLFRWTLGTMLMVPACDDGGGLVGPQPLARDDLAGAYVATTLLVTVGAAEVDVLDGGGVLFITLEPAGTTMGMLFVREEVAGEELAADLSGTWDFRAQGPTVAFEQEADTFVRDLTFQAGCAEDGTIELRTDEIMSGDRFRVVLSRISTIQFPERPASREFRRANGRSEGAGLCPGPARRSADCPDRSPRPA